MSILRAVQRAYQVATERDWNRVYWCIDLHGTVFESSYDSSEVHFIDDETVRALQLIRSLPETKIILWSSVYAQDAETAVAKFAAEGILVDYVNCNDEVENTSTGNFDAKFYFSILVDDKAGFDPKSWPEVAALAKQLSDKLNQQGEVSV